MEAKFKIIWQSKKCTWQHLSIRYGKRDSKNWQIFPIRNVSDNCNRAIMFGVGKLYFTLSYARAGYFNQNRKLFLRKRLWKFHQLFN